MTLYVNMCPLKGTRSSGFFARAVKMHSGTSRNRTHLKVAFVRAVDFWVSFPFHHLNFLGWWPTKTTTPKCQDWTRCEWHTKINFSHKLNLRVKAGAAEFGKECTFFLPLNHIYHYHKTTLIPLQWGFNICSCNCVVSSGTQAFTPGDVDHSMEQQYTGQFYHPAGTVDSTGTVPLEEEPPLLEGIKIFCFLVARFVLFTKYVFIC